MIIHNIQAINIEDVPEECIEERGGELYSHLICIEDDGSKLTEWLKSQGYKFDMPREGEKTWGWLGVWA